MRDSSKTLSPEWPPAPFPFLVKIITGHLAAFVVNVPVNYRTLLGAAWERLPHIHMGKATSCPSPLLWMALLDGRRM